MFPICQDLLTYLLTCEHSHSNPPAEPDTQVKGPRTAQVGPQMLPDLKSTWCRIVLQVALDWLSSLPHHCL